MLPNLLSIVGSLGPVGAGIAAGAQGSNPFTAALSSAYPTASQAIAPDPLAAATGPSPASVGRTGPRDMKPYRGAVQQIESQGSGGYSAIGSFTGKGRAIGAYGVMDYNVGPWSREALGFELTPEKFAANPAAQDAVFDYKFGQYIDKFGSPDLAAQAWFGGEGSVGKGSRADMHGTTVDSYTQMFRQNMAGGGSPAGAENAGGSVQSPTISPEAAARAQVLVDKINGGKSPLERIPQLRKGGGLSGPEIEPVQPEIAEHPQQAPDDFDLSQPMERVAMSRARLQQKSQARRQARRG